METIIIEYLTREEIEKKERKLNRKITIQKSKITKLEESIRELENKKWKFKVDDVALYDGWRKVKIIKLVDFDGYLYFGKLLDTNQCATFRNDELTYYDSYKYEEKLIDKIWELKIKLKERNEK